jgi:hypothetical protein
MTKGATVIVSLLLVWAAGCGTKSAIGNLNVGGGGGNQGPGGSGVGGSGTGGGDQGGTGGAGTGGFGIGGGPGIGGNTFGVGGSGVGGNQFGMGGKGVGGAATGGQRGSCPGQVTLPMNGVGTFAFQPAVDYPTGGGAYAVTAADFNGDGKVDLVVLDQTAGARVMLNNGNGTFGSPANHSLGADAASAFATGDLNGDGKIDIASVSPSGVSVILNQGNGAFGPPVTYVVGTGSNALAIGDLNQDGRADIVVTDRGLASGADVAVLTTTGSGTFTSTNYPLGQTPEAIAIGDLDNDCAPDLIVGGDSGVTVLLNHFGVFQTLGSFANGTTSGSVAVADLNSDGKLDLVEGSGYGASTGAAYVLFNLFDQAGAPLTAPIRYAVTTSSGSTFPTLVMGDMNRDGRADIVVTNGFSVMLNQGDGSFGASTSFAMPDFPTSAAVGDFNGDGLADVAVVSRNINTGFSNLRVLINGSH